MQQVKVTPRNRNMPCRSCGQKVGDVGKIAFATVKYGGRRSTTYCEICGRIVEKGNGHSLLHRLKRLFRRFKNGQR